MGRGFAWFDAGTPASLLEAAEYIGVMQRRQRQLIASPEEIAYLSGWISGAELAQQVQSLGETDYARLLKTVPDRLA
jgi:glucose-1-phosphate thymidylyltransferase